MISIPLYELVIYPFCCKYTLSMLKRIGLGMIITLLGILSVAIMDIIGHAQTLSPECMFSMNNSTNGISIDPLWLVLPIALVAYGEILVALTSKCTP